MIFIKLNFTCFVLMLALYAVTYTLFTHCNLPWHFVACFISSCFHFKCLSLLFIEFIKRKKGGPVAEWLRSLTSVLFIIRSSHRCGFAPRSGHESHVGQAKFCLRVCQVVFPRVLRFSPHLPIDSSRYE